MKYKLRDGVVVETICGTSMLIATLEARKYCDYTTNLNKVAAYILEMVRDEMSLEDMSMKASKDYNISKEQAQDTIVSFLSGMVEKNYVIEESEVLQNEE